MERPSVCKPSKNVSERLQCVRHCAQTYGEMGMNKTETLGADRMEDRLCTLSSDISQIHQERQERRAGRGTGER